VPTTQRVEMLINLDDTGARAQIAGLERRPVTVPVRLAGEGAGGRVRPGDVRRAARGIAGGGGGGLPGIGELPGMGRAGATGRLFAGGYGAAGMILGAGMLASNIFDLITAKGGPKWSQLIGQTVASVGAGVMMIPHPYARIGGALMVAGGTFGPKVWEYIKGPKDAKDVLDLQQLYEDLNAGMPPDRATGAARGAAPPRRPGDAAPAFAVSPVFDQPRLELSPSRRLEELLASDRADETVEILTDIRSALHRLVRQGGYA